MLGTFTFPKILSKHPGGILLLNALFVSFGHTFHFDNKAYPKWFQKIDQAIIFEWVKRLTILNLLQILVIRIEIINTHLLVRVHLGPKLSSDLDSSLNEKTCVPQQGTTIELTSSSTSGDTNNTPTACWRAVPYCL